MPAAIAASTPATAPYIRAIADATSARLRRAARRDREVLPSSASADPTPAVISRTWTTVAGTAPVPAAMPPARVGLPRVPRFYVHDVFERASGAVDRAAYVESVYEAINAVGAGLK